MMFMVPSVYTGYVVGLAWISNTMPRPPAKRAAALAAINTVSNTSSIYASYIYPPSDGPRYDEQLLLCYFSIWVFSADIYQYWRWRSIVEQH